MNPTLRLNDTGEAVRQLTTLLADRGHLSNTGDLFDRTVMRAVEEFQARHVDERGTPLVVDGIVGPLTWWALLHPDNSGILDQPPGVGMPPTGGSERGRAALEAAIGEMNAGAMEVGANNDGPFVRKYLNGIIDPPANWCAGFVSWCFDRHPEGAPFRYSLGARDIRTQFRNKGWSYDLGDGVIPEPGDIVVWWRGQPDGWKGHIGLVLEYSEGGILYTVEGNKGGFPAPVSTFSYVASRMERLLGFGRAGGTGG